MHELVSSSRYIIGEKLFYVQYMYFTYRNYFTYSIMTAII